MSSAVLIVESQPPKFSEVHALFSIIEQYDAIILCVQNSPIVLSTSSVLQLWSTIIEPYKDKVLLAFGDKDFMSISSLPETYKDYDILTIEPHIYVHLQSLNIKSGLLPRVSGYDGVYLRASFRQAKALEWIKQHTKLR